MTGRYAAAYYDALHASRGKEYAAESAKVDAVIRAHCRSGPADGRNGPADGRNGPADGRNGGLDLLDAACGTGLHLTHLRERYRVEGLDVDEGMLAIARERLGPDVPLHHADMLTFDLGRSFDAITCLFSAIGHVRTLPKLRRAVARLAAHLKPGGVLVIEPWIHPASWRGERGLYAELADEPELKLVRVNLNTRRGRTTTIESHYLVGTLDGVEHVIERLRLGLFTHEEYVDAFERAGLTVHHDDFGLIGRGLFAGIAPGP